MQDQQISFYQRVLGVSTSILESAEQSGLIKTTDRNGYVGAAEMHGTNVDILFIAKLGPPYRSGRCFSNMEKSLQYFWLVSDKWMSEYKGFGFSASNRGTIRTPSGIIVGFLLDVVPEINERLAVSLAAQLGLVSMDEAKELYGGLEATSLVLSGSG